MKLLSIVLGIFIGNLIGFSIVFGIWSFIQKKLEKKYDLKELANFIKLRKNLMEMAKIIGNPITKRIK